LWMASPICFMLLAHAVRLAAWRTFWTAGSNNPMSTPIMAMTTRSSINVKPGDGRRDGRMGRSCELLLRDRLIASLRDHHNAGPLMFRVDFIDLFFGRGLGVGLRHTHLDRLLRCGRHADGKPLRAGPGIDLRDLAPQDATGYPLAFFVGELVRLGF